MENPCCLCREHISPAGFKFRITTKIRRVRVTYLDVIQKYLGVTLPGDERHHVCGDCGLHLTQLYAGEGKAAEARAKLGHPPRPSEDREVKMEQQTCDGVCQKVLQRLWDCQQQKEFCDIILETEGGDRVWAHKVIIASGSQVLHSMLVDTLNIKDEIDGMQVLRLSTVGPESLRDMVRFMYIGNVERINMDTVELWERFQISDPIRLCDSNPNFESPDTKVTCPNIKTEVESTPTVVEEEDEDDDNDFVEQNEEDSSTDVKNEEPKSADLHMESESSEHEPPKKRKRKCSSPKRMKNLQLSPNEDLCHDETKLKVQPSRRKINKPRLKKKVSSYNELETESNHSDKCEATNEETKKTSLKKRPTATRKPLGSALCKTCNIQFDTMQLYREHRKTMHKNRHTCFECGASFKRVNKLKDHRVANHFKEGLPQPTWHYCKDEGCKYKTLYPDVLELHFKAAHTEEKAICETCGATFTRPYQLTLHIRRVHGGDGPTYRCEECEMTFSLPSELKIHTDRVHKKAKRYLCDRCPFMGFDKNNVDVHMFNKHQVPLPNSRAAYSCPYCEYQSPAKSVIKAHIERHGEKDYKCDQCESVFRCNRDLRGHQRIKHSTKPRVVHRCPYEGCKYASNYGPTPLRSHISRMHENKDYKPWACEICPYRTNVKGNLHLHLRKVHSLHPQTLQHRVPKLQTEVTDTSPPAKEETQTVLPSLTPENFHNILAETYPSMPGTETLSAQIPQHNPRPWTDIRMSPGLSPGIPPGVPLGAPQVMPPVVQQVAPTGVHSGGLFIEGLP